MLLSQRATCQLSRSALSCALKLSLREEIDFDLLGKQRSECQEQRVGSWLHPLQRGLPRGRQEVTVAACRAACVDAPDNARNIRLECTE